MHGSVLIDTDPGLGDYTTDVDDVLAIVHLVAQGIPIAGLTTCYGNSTLARVTGVARDIGDRFGIAVHPGAAHPGDTRTAAVDALVAHRGIVLAIAPLTNVAAALRAGARFERLIVLGGTTRRWPNLRPIHTTELNLALDPRAAATVLRVCTDLVPMEVCRTISFGAEDLAAAPPWLRQGCARWLATSPLRTGRRRFHPWDLVAALLLTHPELAGHLQGRPKMAERPGWRGRIAIEAGSARILQTVHRVGLQEAWHDTLRHLSPTRR